MAKKLDKTLFRNHNADKFDLEHIINFMKDKDVCYRDWSSQMECDYCNHKGLEYFREQETFYNKETGFSNIEQSDDDEFLDFAIYRCPKCGKWDTYIE